MGVCNTCSHNTWLKGSIGCACDCHVKTLEDLPNNLTSPEYVELRKLIQDQDQDQIQVKPKMTNGEKKELYKKYYHKNKNKILVLRKKYYDRNKEETLRVNRQYHEKNKDRLFAYNKEYRERNKDKLAAQHKEYYSKNRDKIIAYNRRYRKGLKFNF